MKRLNSLFMAGFGAAMIFAAPASAKYHAPSVGDVNHPSDVEIKGQFADGELLDDIKKGVIRLPEIEEPVIVAGITDNNSQFDCACAAGNIITYGAGAIGFGLGSAAGGGPVTGALLGGTMYSGAEIAHQGAHGESVWGGPLKGKSAGKGEPSQNKPVD